MERKSDSLVLDLFESLWKVRNKVLFGDTLEDQLRLRTAKADRTIYTRRLFTQSVGLPHDKQYPFRESMATILAKPPQIFSS